MCNTITPAMEEYNPDHINYALVEATRPPMYKAMKYWGRKPHNIWSDYIKHYCPENGVVLDPFMGSGISTFECLKNGRKVISTDLNPLSAFVIDVLTSPFDKTAFTKAVDGIKKTIELDTIYRDHYLKTTSSGQEMTIYNYIWIKGSLTHVRMKDDKGQGVSTQADNIDLQKAISMKDLDISYWYPQDPFPRNPSINNTFIKKIGGNSFDCLWTRRNLYILAKIFDLIRHSEKSVRLPLMYAFVHTLHLVSKMVVPRGEAGNRDFSGSWGRADYMIRNRSMEQNPLIVFLRSCFDKQGVVNAMIDVEQSIPANKKFKIKNSPRWPDLKADVNYGVLDIADICDYIAADSIDFIITDPPYGGLVQYMDLSLVWLVWLQHFNKRYTPDSSGEITYKKGITSRNSYTLKLDRAFKNLYNVLKPNHYMVVTFHNQDIKEWNDFVSAIRKAGFVFEKVTHQYNRRSGESNVANPYGTTSSDFYIRCKKATDSMNLKGDVELYHFVRQKTIDILVERAEKTPFTFILNGLLPDMLQAGYLQPDEPAEEIQKILSTDVGKDRIFCVEKNQRDQSGDYYWFNNPSSYISHLSFPLSERVDLTIRSFLRRNVSVRYDDVVAEIFKQFPNGQTPDMQGISKVLSKYAQKSQGKWKLKDDVETECTTHTHIIEELCYLARKAHFEPFVGRREQSEFVDGQTKLIDLSSYADLDTVLTGYDNYTLSRIEMIDNVWLSGNKISAVFEVENSTGFIEAISRSSNLEGSLPKFMIIPDRRVQELQQYQDPMFLESFRSSSWRYLTYEDIRKLKTSQKISIDDIKALSKKL